MDGHKRVVFYIIALSHLLWLISCNFAANELKRHLRLRGELVGYQLSKGIKYFPVKKGYRIFSHKKDINIVFSKTNI